MPMGYSIADGTQGYSDLSNLVYACGLMGFKDEEFEALMTEKILQTDPDSLAFVKAAKTARPNAKTGQHAHGGPRSKPRAFQ